MVLAGIKQAGGPVARILALDRGAGIPNLAKAMTDGYSTSGTMGGGLGAMKRIASALEVFSGKTGTIVMLELGEAAQAQALRVAGMAVPYPGERVCGDDWSCDCTADRVIVALVDGLGHGWGAAEAAKEGIATFHERSDLAPARILDYMHDAMRKTRGGVAAIAELRPKERLLTFAGIGNICCSLFSQGASRSYVSHNGTLGVRISKIQEFRSEWPADGVLVLHSDGLQSKWDLNSYPGLISRHPAVIGGALLRDFRRQRDDASVIVIKATP